MWKTEAKANASKPIHPRPLHYRGLAAKSRMPYIPLQYLKANRRGLLLNSLVCSLLNWRCAVLFTCLFVCLFFFFSNSTRFESRYVKRIMRCINFIRCPNWLHPLLYNVNRLSWVRLGLSCVKLSNETVSGNKCRPISLAAFPRNNLHNKVKPWWAFFFFNMCWRYKICIAKCLYSWRDNLFRNLFQNHGRGVQKVQFRLTCVAQKHRCLNSLLTIQWLTYNQSTSQIWSAPAGYEDLAG